MFLVRMVLCQLQVSAAAVTADDTLSGAALCHVRSSLVRISTLVARLVLRLKHRTGQEEENSSAPI